jgi:hypothetical protein
VVGPGRAQRPAPLRTGATVWGLFFFAVLLSAEGAGWSADRPAQRARSVRGQTKPQERRRTPTVQPPALSRPAQDVAATVAAANPYTPPEEPISVEEARHAAGMLNDVYQYSLSEIHRRFPAGTGQPIPAATLLKEIQRRMHNRGWATSRFVATTTPPMNRDHLPRDDFERRVADEMVRGSTRVEQISGGKLRVAFSVPLTGSCYPCHSLPNGGSARAAISFTFAVRDQSPPAPHEADPAAAVPPR